MSDQGAHVGRAALCSVRSRAALWAKLTATFFGIGLLRPGPGTWASAVTILLWWFAARWIPLSSQTPVVVALALIATAVGIPASTQISRATGLKDPQFVVIDEVAGQLVAVFAVPVSWKSILLGFILFRGFDILKPPPVRQIESLPEGLGIVVDDLGAGVYALILMQLALHFRLLPR